MKPLTQVPYSERVVDRWEDENTGRVVSTAWTADGMLPYETAVQHPDYNSHGMMIVAAYATREEAVMGHGEWVGKMIAGLPEIIPVKINVWMAEELQKLGMKMQYRRGEEGME